MSSVARRTAAVLLALAAAAPLPAQTAVYDFESFAPLQPLPACLTDGGIQACFTADQVRDQPQLPEPPGFFGNRIGSFFDFWSVPVVPARLAIAFDTELRGISFPFQFRPIGGFVPPLEVTLEAFLGGAPAGTCHVPSSMVILRPIPGPDLERAGEAGWLRCTPGLFDSVVITGDIRGMNLWIDNVRVAVSPEPGAVLLVASGLLAIGGMARRRRA